MGTVLALAAIGLGLAGIAGYGLRPLQCDGETPKDWVQRGPVTWPVLNGAALGVGATSRIGFWLWYAIPAGCFLLANPLVGAAIWATYGFVRTACVSVIWLIGATRPDIDTTVALLRQRDRARTTATTLLLILGLAMFFLVGL
jgi:hypothetical protein